MEEKLRKISESPEYQELIKARSKSKWTLAVVMLVVYYGFIMVIAFAPEIFAQSVGGGHMSVGILVGLIVIFFSFVITGIYVHKANTVFEPLSKKLHEAAEDLS